MDISIGIGLLGYGTVGREVALRLLRERDSIIRRSGVRYELRAVAIRDVNKPREAHLADALLVGDARAIVADPHIDLVVESIGGVNEAARLVESALDRGLHVVTANKDLIATQGPRLHALASARGATLQYEAAACSAIPIVRILTDALAGDNVLAIAGVFNGTCTAILSAMEEGADYQDALADAQARGYAEADPRSDVEGDDATHKLALLAQLAFEAAIISPRIARTGIAGVARRDIARAKMLGYRLRLIAAARRTENGICAEVAPLLVREEHPFAQARGPENVVTVRARDAGELQLRGTGAGGTATSSAILGDVVATLRAIAERRVTSASRLTLEPILDVEPFFHEFARHQELPRYAVWEDRHLNTPTSHVRLAQARE